MSAKMNRRVSAIAKELKKLHTESVDITTNYVTVVTVLIASVAFMYQRRIKTASGRRSSVYVH
ncbi:hypothetical protein AMTR_s00060p00116030 [Amborella trichopoda]|uniref:PGG domain-containing protein n=1 Tax=Amborella trichopoda TaxID=13333 RepID=W1NK63_AMBTC|nr:hypothetical protein AMTR_s00060p00116030 [Amborella trichopoda]